MSALVRGARGARWSMVLLVACSSSSKNFFPSGHEQGGAAGTPPASGGAAGKGSAAKGGMSGAAAGGSGAGRGGTTGGAGGAGGASGNAGTAVAGSAQAGTGGGDESGGSGNVSQGGSGGTAGACDPAAGDCTPAVCAAVKHVEVPLDLFGDVRDQHTVVRLGDRFALYATGRALRAGGADVAFVSWDGVDAHDHFELDDPCPDDVCATSLGLSALSTASGSPELSMVDEGSAAAMTTYPVRAVAWDKTQAMPGITPLFEAPIDFQTISELASSKNGERAVFAAGNGGGSVNIAELGPNAELAAPVSTLAPPSGGWDCLNVVPTKDAGAVSVVAGGPSDSESVWLIRELDANGNTALEVNATVPAGAALGYTGCPMLVESPVGFHAIWNATDKESIMATALRESAPDTAPTITTFPVVAGSLVGGRSDMLVFLVELDDGSLGFRGIDRNGNDVAKLYVLPPLPPRTSEHPRTFPMLLSVEGSSLYVSYELETTRVIEQVVCD